MALVSGEELEINTVELPCSALTWDAGTMAPLSDLDLTSLEPDGDSFSFAIAQLAGKCTNSPRSHPARDDSLFPLTSHNTIRT